MREDDTEAGGELKRADHLIYVTLKYTKTCDVIKNVVRRLINAYDAAITYALEKLKNKGKLEKVPFSPLSRAELLKNLSKRNLELLDMLNLYFELKVIDKAEYTKKEEFRKNVTLTVVQEDNVYEVNIVKLQEYFKKTKSFVDYIEKNY